MNNMRKLINLMEGVMAVPGLNEQNESDMQTSASAADDAGYAGFDAAQSSATEIDEISAYGDDMGGEQNTEALEMFDQLVDNFVDPDAALNIVLDHFREAGLDDGSIHELEAEIMQARGSEVDTEPGGSSDMSDDADALASAGFGSDEDYGGYGDDGDLEEARKSDIDTSEVNSMINLPHEAAKSRAQEILAASTTNDNKKAYLANQINGTRDTMAVIKLLYDMILKGEGHGVQGSAYSKKFDKTMEEAFDMQNGYNDIDVADGNDYFPNGADGPVVRATGPSGARHGDNPEQKKMQVSEVHKELVYGYRNFLKESKKPSKK